MDTDLSKCLMDLGFTSEEIDICKGNGPDYAGTVMELWSHWFSNFCKVDKDFLGERFYNEDISKSRQNMVLQLVHQFDKDRQIQSKPGV